MSASVLPTAKVTAGVLAGAVAGIVLWAVKTFAHQEVPIEVGMAISTLLTFVIQYLVPEETSVTSSTTSTTTTVTPPPAKDTP
jgi:hypothetical protein